MKSHFGALGFGPYTVSRLPITVLYGYGAQPYAYFDLLEMEEGSLEMKKQQRYRSAEEWEDLVARIRLLPGFIDFLKPKRAAYFTSCEFGGMVVLLNVHNTYCDAIVLGSNKERL